MPGSCILADPSPIAHMNVKKSPWYTDGPVYFRILGEDIQEVEFLMEPGQRIMLQPDTFVAAVGGVRSLGVTWGRSLLDPVLRRWSGEAAVLQEIVCEDEPARVILGAGQFGRIVRLKVTRDRPIFAQRGAFVAASGTIDLGIAVTARLRAGLFGGQGIVFQRISGEGDVFLHALGTVNDWILPKGKIARCSTNNILAFDASVGYDVQFAGGAMTLLFGSQGFFLSQLEGPGRVITQSLDHGAFVNTLVKHNKRALKTSSATQQTDDQ